MFSENRNQIHFKYMKTLQPSGFGIIVDKSKATRTFRYSQNHFTVSKQKTNHTTQKINIYYLCFVLALFVIALIGLISMIFTGHVYWWVWITGIASFLLSFFKHIEIEKKYNL